LDKITKDVQSTPPWHGDIENDQVPRLLPGAFESLLRRHSFTELGVRVFIFQQFSHPAPDNGMVVCQENM
jgi:hypothetical protein